MARGSYHFSSFEWGLGIYYFELLCRIEFEKSNLNNFKNPLWTLGGPLWKFEVIFTKFVYFKLIILTVESFFTSGEGNLVALASERRKGENRWLHQQGHHLGGSFQGKTNRCQFYQHFLHSFYEHRPQNCKKYWWFNWIFTLLGTALVKAAHKHAGEIDPMIFYWLQ